MELRPSRIEGIGRRIVDRDLLDRHLEQTRQLYATIYGITPGNARENLDIIFKRVIQERANPLQREEYHELLDNISPQNVVTLNTHQDAFEELCSQKHIGQKIANEFLRQIAHVFELREGWISELAVPLDTHVVQMLVKTDAISLTDEERDRRPGQIINMAPTSNPHKRIGYQEVQNGFQQAGEQIGVPRIVFDELWLEHRSFLQNPLLQAESEFYDMFQTEYRFDE